jgi:citrate synthase
LYAYVSRGLVRSEAAGGSRRNRRYHAEDVRALKERKERRRPEDVAEGALSCGTPVMESAITLVEGGRLYYRGRDAVELARGRGVEDVAALIWTGEEAASGLFEGEAGTLSGGVKEARRFTSRLTPVEAVQMLLPLAAAEDPAAYDLRPRAVASTGGRMLRFMTGVLAGAEAESVAGALQKGWTPGEPRAGRLFDAALVLCADHELPVSTFAVRCVASSGATPYAAVLAGLSAVQGVRHGGQIELAEKLLREAEGSGDARGALAERLRRGESIPGFGYTLYPDGDPRGAELLRLVREAYPGRPAVEVSEAVVQEAWGLLGERPTVDLGLAALARAAGLPAGAAVALFALGRTVGWVGHAIEQYAGDVLIRPRARYVGEQPAEGG